MEFGKGDRRIDNDTEISCLAHGCVDEAIIETGRRHFARDVELIK